MSCLPSPGFFLGNEEPRNKNMTLKYALVNEKYYLLKLFQGVCYAWGRGGGGRCRGVFGHAPQREGGNLVAVAGWLSHNGEGLIKSDSPQIKGDNS